MTAYRLCRACGGFHDLADAWPDGCVSHFQNYSVGGGLQIIRDTAAYRSMITGQVIDGRRQHRDHLKAHGCVEVGNDTSHITRKPSKPKTSRKELMHRQMADMSDRQVQAIVKQEIKNRHV